MNYPILARYLGLFLAAISLTTLPSLACSLYFREWQMTMAFLETLAAGLAAGGLLYLAGRRGSKNFFQREALGLVGLGWLAGAIIAAMPYYFSGALSPIDAYFEGMSGLTTTGATVLSDIEAAPLSLLFWRSFTQWLGGMGIILLFIAVLPYLGAGGKQLFRTELTGPDPRGLKPRVRDTASLLWKLYLGLTVTLAALLFALGMNPYDALCHTFSTVSTGGFSPRQASVGAFDNARIEAVMIFFMIIGGTNFALFFAMFGGNWRALTRNTEWRAFILILAGASMLIAVNLHQSGIPQGLIVETSETSPDEPYSWSRAIRSSSFQVVSIMTSSGFTTDDFDGWPKFSRTLLILLMFVGGCAGSTSGGMKVIRIILLAKMAYWRLESTFRPRTVRAIRVDGNIIDESIQKTTYAFFVLYLGFFVFGWLFLSLYDLPFATTFSAVVANLSNIGPGLELVGAVEDYNVIPPAGKLFLALCMVVGRLEVYTMLVLIIPSFWRPN